MTPLSNHHDVIILGLTANGLGILRSLGKYKIVCSGIYSNKRLEAGYYSRYLKRAEHIPVEWKDKELFLALQRLSQQLTNKPAVLFPTSDAFVWFLARNRQRLQEEYLFYSPSQHLLSLLNDKSQTIRLEQFGLNIPFTVTIQTEQDLHNYDRQGSFPAIIKPVTANDPSFPAKVIFIDTFEELSAFFVDHPALYGRCILQQVIAGGDKATWEVASFSETDNNLFRCCTIHKIRQYPPSAGISSFIKTEENKKLTTIVQRVLAQTKYSGLADWEFLFDEKKRKYFLIDINCRTGMPNQLCSDAGMDLTLLAYNRLTGNHINCSCKQQDNVYYINFEWDIGSFFRKKQEDEITIIGWLRSLLLARSFAFFSWKDPAPFFITLYKVAQLIFRKIFFFT